ncbi:hypothetical protein [Streptococcus equinus]|jgi:hypothetical protein|nr:hypothetical protein [Streptococcus equinus]SDQ35608.1 hypothetical protein SAMN05216407_1206 [Streptococcus equinus]
MTEWKMSELESVKELTDSDLEKTVGGNWEVGSIISWLPFSNSKPQRKL